MDTVLYMLCKCTYASFLTGCQEESSSLTIVMQSSRAPQSCHLTNSGTRNYLARVICQQSWFTDARLLLWSLHWLPIREKSLYKIALLTYKTQWSATPWYLADLLLLQAPVRPLQSAGTALLSVSWSQTVLATRAFSVAAPTVWNALPHNVRLYGSADTFRKKLKTALFRTAYL